jgi:hypothetical protein
MPVYYHETIDPVRQPDKQYEYLDHMEKVIARTNAEGSPMRNVANWVTVWATGQWPEVVGLWEMESWDWFAEHFNANRLFREIPQEFYAFRTGGFDRVLIPSRICPTLDQIVANGVRAPVVLQEIVHVAPGTCNDYLEALGDAGHAIGAKERGVRLFGAYQVALRNRSEVLNLWAFDDFDTYVRTEREPSADPELAAWREGAASYELDHVGKLMCPTEWSALR